jgi:hypothetical protein
MKLQTMIVKAILCLDTDMFISRFSLREDFIAYSITFLKEFTFQYICLSRVKLLTACDAVTWSH